ncbi:Rsd/AlgQ family anti-sigma factor [Photobacterium galatheae]|uniref:Anti-RNA polymerase sigma 70 factor n=1 Tax=Photobacterium galatheae TaxID=1654360 RepID=A0A066RS87_9GAMM|nr:Rsd/AlgQ family anti-sigma factor [Photobacterium galatheae]KDM91991.1 anti-RNA polymerase sigma 70 factor [Photobacterium galatheae]MCM0151277.1 Rsd/AlgQ family anti-sigma factor [Photobacterium galatheae]
MLSKFEQVQKQWGGNNDVIDHWLLSRQQLLIDYCKLAGLPPFEPKARQLPTSAQLQLFCQQLVDYISEGHFKIYDKVMARWQATGYSPTTEISQLYHQITNTTDPLLNFADRYCEITDDSEDWDDFDQHLSTVGEQIELRFELEDELIELISESLSVPPGA